MPNKLIKYAANGYGSKTRKKALRKNPYKCIYIKSIVKYPEEKVCNNTHNKRARYGTGNAHSDGYIMFSEIFFKCRPKKDDIRDGTERKRERKHKHFCAGETLDTKEFFKKNPKTAYCIKETEKNIRGANTYTAGNKIYNERFFSIACRVISSHQKKEKPLGCDRKRKKSESCRSKTRIGPIKCSSS